MPTCSAQGLSLPVTENFGFGVFLGLFSFLHGVLCLWGVPGFTGLPVVYKTWVIQVCLLMDYALWAEVGGEHYLCNLWGKYLKVHKIAYKYLGVYVGFMMWEPYASLSGTAQSPWL